MDRNENDELGDDESNDSDIYSADISLQDYESNNSESDDFQSDLELIQSDLEQLLQSDLEHSEDVMDLNGKDLIYYYIIQLYN